MTRTASYLSPHEMFLLDLACRPLREAFETPPYLVGSAAERADYRDVDVRLILDDDYYEQVVTAVPLALLNLTITAYLRQVTGLPVDFGIQQQTAASDQHPGKSRNPLGLRTLDNFVGDGGR